MSLLSASKQFTKLALVDPITGINKIIGGAPLKGVSLGIKGALRGAEGAANWAIKHPKTSLTAAMVGIPAYKGMKRGFSAQEAPSVPKPSSILPGDNL